MEHVIGTLISTLQSSTPSCKRMFPDFIWLTPSSIGFEQLGQRRGFREIIEPPYTRENSIGSEQEGVALTIFFGRDTFEHGQNTHNLVHGGKCPAPKPARRFIGLGFPALICADHTRSGVNQSKIGALICEAIEHQCHHGRCLVDNI